MRSRSRLESYLARRAPIAAAPWVAVAGTRREQDARRHAGCTGEEVGSPAAKAQLRPMERVPLPLETGKSSGAWAPSEAGLAAAE